MSRHIFCVILTNFVLFLRLSSWWRHHATRTHSSTAGEGKYDSVLQPSTQSHPHHRCRPLLSCLRKSSAKSGTAALQTRLLSLVRIHLIQ